MKKEKEQSSSEEQKAANENLLIRLNQNYGKLSKGQKGWQILLRRIMTRPYQ